MYHVPEIKSIVYKKKKKNIRRAHKAKSPYHTYPRKYAFFVSQKSETPTWGNISFCKISLAYLILFSLVTPGLAPRAPIKFKATFCSCMTNASSRDGLTCMRNHNWLNSIGRSTHLNRVEATYHFHHFLIFEIVNNMLKNISIGYEA